MPRPAAPAQGTRRTGPIPRVAFVPTPEPNVNLPALRRMAGVSLVEASVVLAVTSALAGSLLPSLGQASARRHLEGQAAELATRLHEARALAVSLNRTVHVTFGSSDRMACYVVHAGERDGCHCSDDGQAVCQAGSKLLGANRFDAAGPATLTSNVGTMTFDPQHGTVTPAGTLTLKSREGTQTRLIVNVMGRVRSCGVLADRSSPVVC